MNPTPHNRNTMLGLISLAIEWMHTNDMHHATLTDSLSLFSYQATPFDDVIYQVYRNGKHVGTVFLD